MKNLALCLSLAALAACGQRQSGSQITQATAIVPEPAPTSHAGPGTYSVTEIDGTKMTAVFASDHTYTNTVHGRETETGAWAIVGGRTCLTPRTGESAVARCYTDSPLGKDGSFIATPDHGHPLTVKKIV